MDFRSRATVAFILVVLITLATVLDYKPVQITGGVALLVLILQTVFEIHEKVVTTTSRQPGWYPTFQEALPDMTGEIGQRLRRGAVRMRWIGVTQEAGWPFSQNLILEVLGGEFGKDAAIHVELALLDHDGEICGKLGGPDKNQIKTTQEKIKRFRRRPGQSIALSKE